MEIYKFLSGILLLFILGNCSITKGQNNKLMSPFDTWDEYISSYAINLPDYIKLKQSKKNSNYVIFSSDVKELELIEEKGNLTIKCKNLAFSTEFKFNEVYILNAYKVNLMDEKLLIVEWRNKYSVGRALNDINYSVVDLVQKKLYFYTCFNGRILCFTDLDGDNKIDFIKIEETDYYSMIPFEENYTEVYRLIFTALDNSMKENIQQNIYVVDCANLGYANLSEQEIEKIEESPCERNSKK